MKLKTNSDQIAEANSTRWWFFSIGVKKLPVGMMKRNDGPAAPNRVVDIELVPPMSNFVSLRCQLGSAILGAPPSLKPRSLCKSVRHQVVAHGKLGSEVFDGVIANSQRLAIRNTDTLQRHSEQLPLNIAPLSDGATKLVIEGTNFLGNVHDVTTKTPNVLAQGREAGLPAKRPSGAKCYASGNKMSLQSRPARRCEPETKHSHQGATVSGGRAAFFCSGVQPKCPRQSAHEIR